jgi:hypothetical protein
MNIQELHTLLHPRLGSYKGPANQYAHKLGEDLSALLEHQANGSWKVTLFERGQATSGSTHGSEAEACDALLALVNS